MSGGEPEEGKHQSTRPTSRGRMRDTQRRRRAAREAAAADGAAVIDGERKPRSRAGQTTGRAGVEQATAVEERQSSPRGSRNQSARLAEVRAEKRDRFITSQNSKGNSTTLLYAVIGVLLLIILGGGTYFVAGESLGLKANSTVAQSTPVTASSAPEENGLLKLAAATYDDGKAHFYTYKNEGMTDKKIRFMVLKSADGVIRAAFDACDVCFTYKKGYRQQDDEVVCNNCGQRFPSIKINEVKGGCNPVPLTRSVQGDTLVISEKDVIGEGEPYF